MHDTMPGALYTLSLLLPTLQGSKSGILFGKVCDILHNRAVIWERSPCWAGR